MKMLDFLLEFHENVFLYVYFISIGWGNGLVLPVIEVSPKSTLTNIYVTVLDPKASIHY